MKDPLTEEKDEIAAEANEAFDAEDMVGALESELNDDIDAGLGDTGDDDEEVGEALSDDAAGAVDDDDAGAADPAETATEPAKGAGPDRGDGRDDKGKFASEKAAADAKAAGKTPAEQKAAGDAAAAAATKPAAAPAPKWEAFTVRADKAIHPIEGVKMLRQTDPQGNEHVIIAVPAKGYREFEHRISRGISSERRWRELTEKEREIDFQRTAPKPRTDSEIEADMFMKALTEKGALEELFDPQELENLKLRVQLAQRDEKVTFDKKETERRQEASAGDDWQRYQTETLVDEAFNLVEQHPDLKGMDPEKVREVLQEFAMPVRDKLVYKENGESFVNNEYLFKLLKREHQAPQSAAPAKPDSPAAPGTGASSADRFNKGTESAATPRSTSLRNNRDRPPARRPAPDKVAAAADHRTPAQKAEDEARATRRKMLSSASLDFDDDE